MDWFLLSLLTACIWGTAPYFEKSAISQISNIFTAVSIRSLGVSLGLLIPIFNAPAREALMTVPPKAAIFLVIAGFWSSIAGQLVYLTALRHGEVSRVTPVAAAWPVVTFFVAVLFLGEAFTIKKLIAAILVVSGICLLRN